MIDVLKFFPVELPHNFLLQPCYRMTNSHIHFLCLFIRFHILHGLTKNGGEGLRAIHLFQHLGMVGYYVGTIGAYNADYGFVQ
jgi:hypothetical protein